VHPSCDSLVGIGLFYGQGYFRQRLDHNGWQQEEYLETDVTQLPWRPRSARTGRPVVVKIDYAQWLYTREGVASKVGRCDLFLLDSDIEETPPTTAS